VQRGIEELGPMLTSKMEQAVCIARLEYGPDRAIRFRLLQANPTFETYTGLRGVTGQCVSAGDLGCDADLIASFARVAETGQKATFTHPSGPYPFFRGWACRIGGAASRKLAVVFEQVPRPPRSPIDNGSSTTRLAAESQRKDLFMATLAHELRNTMAPLGSALELLGCGRADAGTVAEALPMARRQLQHMSRLVGELLDVGRIVNDRMELQPSRVPIHELVSDAVQACAAAAAQRGHALSVDMPAALLWVNADPVRFNQVMVNLLSNAIKFTRPGGHISVCARADARDVQLRITDNGVGIAAEELDTVFDMFGRAKHSKTLSIDGLGIGLSLVRRLVELHGGTVYVQSEGRDKGTTFTVTLPLCD
jgi:signal transduction histidine kinase